MVIAHRSHLSAVRAPLTAVLAVLALAQSACDNSAHHGPAVQPAHGVAVLAVASPPPSGPVASAPAALQPPRVGARSVIVMNFDTGTVLYAERTGARRPIASLTKIMTAMVVLERTRPTDVITASKLAAKQIPTKLGLKAGDRMNVQALLYALMLHSSNDVAVALAQHVSGSVRAFDALMTTQGVDIGLTDTWFASPSGLNDQGYSTARDVAAMTRWAYGSPTFASLVATRKHTVRLPSGKRVHLHNLNDLLFDYPGAIGVKTGYTSASHWSLVGIAKRGPIRIMVVLLGDRDHIFGDGAALLDWGFARESSFLGRQG